ncbi:MAG: Uma2 family endonuclease [Deltaproteobacteria bacterium]|nr:Uma2 family endonuclease [Deltaproteobacteria bacterium]
MSVSALPTSRSSEPAATPRDPIWRLRVEQYHAMISAGILTADDPVELLEGWLVYKMPQNPPHRVATRLAQTALERILPTGWYVDTQAPITLEDSEPEPDVAIIRGEPRLYSNRHPGPADLALVVEVADATLLRDQGAKKRLYARAGIAVYWLIKLPDRQCEVYTDPSAAGGEPDYRQRHNSGQSETVPLIIDGQAVGSIVVADVLP